MKERFYTPDQGAGMGEVPKPFQEDEELPGTSDRPMTGRRGGDPETGTRGLATGRRVVIPVGGSPERFAWNENPLGAEDTFLEALDERRGKDLSEDGDEEERGNPQVKDDGKTDLEKLREGINASEAYSPAPAKGNGRPRMRIMSEDEPGIARSMNNETDKQKQERIFYAVYDRCFEEVTRSKITLKRLAPRSPYYIELESALSEIEDMLDDAYDSIGKVHFSLDYATEGLSVAFHRLHSLRKEVELGKEQERRAFRDEESASRDEEQEYRLPNEWSGPRTEGIRDESRRSQGYLAKIESRSYNDYVREPHIEMLWRRPGYIVDSRSQSHWVRRGYQEKIERKKDIDASELGQDFARFFGPRLAKKMLRDTVILGTGKALAELTIAFDARRAKHPEIEVGSLNEFFHPKIGKRRKNEERLLVLLRALEAINKASMMTRGREKAPWIFKHNTRPLSPEAELLAKRMHEQNEKEIARQKEEKAGRKKEREFLLNAFGDRDRARRSGQEIPEDVHARIWRVNEGSRVPDLEVPNGRTPITMRKRIAGWISTLYHALPFDIEARNKEQELKERRRLKKEYDEYIDRMIEEQKQEQERRLRGDFPNMRTVDLGDEVGRRDR